MLVIFGILTCILVEALKLMHNKTQLETHCRKKKKMSQVTHTPPPHSFPRQCHLDLNQSSQAGL